MEGLRDAHIFSKGRKGPSRQRQGHAAAVASADAAEAVADNAVVAPVKNFTHLQYLRHAVNYLNYFCLDF